MSRHFERLNREKYDGYEDTVREDKVMHKKFTTMQTNKLCTNVNQSSEDSIRASFAINEMTAKSSRPFTEVLFV